MSNCKFLKTPIISIIFSFFVVSSLGENYDFNHVGPHVKMTHGEVWPKPMIQQTHEEYLKLVQPNFKFNVTGHCCDILKEAIKRYKCIPFLNAKNSSTRVREGSSNITVVGTLSRLDIHLENECEKYPTLEMDEEYKISINKSGGILSAYSIWGVLRGLETFSQLVSLENVDGLTFVIRSTTIQDCPKFKHRGFLLDTGRHFIPVESIFDTLNAMAYSKLNVFHWHMVDDQSFPFQSSVYPELSKKGAYADSAVYTVNDVKRVVEYARFLGIRVIPEFDMPGHTSSWGLGGIPGLLSECSSPNCFGPINPTIKQNYYFIKNLLTEVSELFPDQCMHLGGDTVDKSCWMDNKKILEFMLQMELCDFSKLQNYFYQNIFNITRKLKTVPIVWQDVLDDNVRLDPNVIVQIWKDNHISTMLEVMKSGHRIILSSCWHMDCVHYGPEWLKYYRCDPNRIADHKGLILGGEGYLRGEFVDETNLLTRTWPNLCAVAEVLWSHEHNETEAAGRLEEHVCRMRRRGIPAKPANGPHFCYY